MKWRSDTAPLRQKSKLISIMRDNAGEKLKIALMKLRSSFSPRTAAEIDSSKTGDRPLIYQHAASNYSRSSLRQIKLKLQVEGFIEVLSIKEIMERKTAKDTKVDRKWPDHT
jgi:hypothetical protein